jgi:hypothetical protein
MSNSEDLAELFDFVAIFERSNFPARTLVEAINSSQTTFEEVAEPTDKGLPFVTRVTDSPIQIGGRLGLDGVWRVKSCVVSVSAEYDMTAEVTIAKALDPDTFVLGNGKVAEAMIRYVIAKMLAGGGMPPEARAIFERRLAQSRFADGVTIQ